MPHPLLCLLLLGALAAPAAARTLEVGPGKAYAMPSEAARAAAPGDRILISPGRYRDCATWHAPDLTIEAAAGEAVIHGPVCGDKALFIVAAPRVAIIGIAFMGAVAPDRNGAGIRAEGGDLTIRNSRFLGNETAILANPVPGARLTIADSVFLGNGIPDPERGCAHGLYVNEIAELVITRSHFEATRACHHVKSRAARTEIIDTWIIDGEDTRTSYLIDVPNGGDLLIARSTLRKGPRALNTRVAIAIGAEGLRHPTTTIRIEANDFTNLQPVGTAFVRNWTGLPAELVGNRLRGPVTALQGAGTVR